MKVLIYGVGGVGGFIGSFLEKTDFEVSYIARGKRYEFLKNKGLILNSQIENLKFKKISVINELNEGDHFDLIIITVKLYDFDNVLTEIKQKIKGNYIILPFQNGIYAEEKIKKLLGPENTFGAVAQISAHIDEKQTVQHIGKLATFFIGNYDGERSNILENFCKKVQENNLSIIYKNNIKEKIWEKFIFLSAYSGMTTLTEKTIGQIFENKNLKNKFLNAMKEAYLLSKEFKVEFKRDPLEFWINKIKTMPYEMTSSMYHDFKAKKKLELKWLSGSILNLGKSMNMKFEVSSEIVNGIKSK